MQKMSKASTPTQQVEQMAVPHVLLIFSILIAIFGTAANSLSLSYFITTIRSNCGTKNSDGPTTKLFAALNILDLLVSVFLTVMFLLSLFSEDVVLQEVVYTVFIISAFLTGFLTCLLAVVRATHLILPLHVVNWRAVNASSAVYFTILVVVRSVHLITFHTTGNVFAIDVIFSSLIATVFLTVVVSNVISVIKLYFSQFSHTETKDVKKRATITVTIISVIYLICNIGFVVLIGVGALSRETLSLVSNELFYAAYFILPALNSACNPVVYFIRKEEMREYVKTLFGRVGGCFCKKRTDNSTVVELHTQ